MHRSSIIYPNGQIFRQPVVGSDLIMGAVQFKAVGIKLLENCALIGTKP